MSNNSSYSLEKQMIVRHVTECKYNNKHDTGTPPAKRCRRTTACVSPTVTANSINLPNPESGNAYNKMEVVNIMSKVPERTHIHAATVEVILKHQQKYNIPCSRTSIYRLLANHAKGQMIKRRLNSQQRIRFPRKERYVRH